MNRLKTDEGFTLFEMLISLAIVGVVFGLFASVIGFGRNVFDRMAGSSDRLDELASTRRLLAETLSQVVVTERKGLAGEVSWLDVVAYGPHALGLTAPVHTVFRPSPNGGGLVADWFVGGSKQAVSHRIVRTATVVDFAFFHKRRGWQSRWDPGGPLPELVRVQLRDDSGRTVGEFALAVRQLEPPLCLASPSGRCAVSR
jgi:prepilin-type N-terminal cleavage/methylation domain-containing protein